MRSCLLSVFLCLLGSMLQAAEPTTEDLIKQLQEAVAKAVKEAKEKGNEGGGGRYSEMSPYLGQLSASIRQSLARNDINSLQQVVGQIQSMLANEEIRKISDALLEKIQKEMAAHQQAYIASLDASVEKAVKTSFAATEPKDLDALIIELSQASQRQNYNSSFEPSQRSAEKARAAVTFMCRWQDYLMQTKSGNLDAAQGVLKTLSQDTSSYPFVPRSEILDRMKPVAKNAGSDGEIPVDLPALSGKTLKDIEDLKAATRELLYRNRSSQPLRQFSDQLNALDRAYEQLHSGLVGQAFSFCTERNGGNNGEEFLALRQALLLEVLPVYLNTAKSYPVASTDTPTEYLLRVVKEARTKADWVTVWKTLEAYRTVAFSSGQMPGWLNADIQGISQFIVGQNLEKAGQYVDAIRAYKRVLSQPGENLPIKEATERLNALKKEHPEDFEAAAKPAEIPQGRSYPFNPATGR